MRTRELVDLINFKIDNLKEYEKELQNYNYHTLTLYYILCNIRELKTKFAN